MAETSGKCESLKAEANAEYAAKNYDLAIQLYTHAAHYNSKRYKEALEDAEACLAEDNKFIKGYSRKGLALMELGRPGHAELCYREGLKVDPGSEVLKAALAKSCEDDPKLKSVRALDGSDRQMRGIQSRVGVTVSPPMVNSFGYPSFTSAYVGHLGELKRTLVPEDLTRHISELELPITIICVAGAQRVTGPCEHAKVLRHLIAQGCRVNARDVAGMTALMHTVCQVPMPELLEILLVEGRAEVNLRDCYGSSALHYAAHTKGALPCLKLLIKHGADLNLRDNDGGTPMDYGAAFPEVAAELNKAADRKRESPLFVPSLCGQCGAEGAKLSCAQCRSVKYCNQDCQKQHWKSHKPQCRAPVDDIISVPMWPEGPDVPPTMTAIDRRKFNREMMDMMTGAQVTPLSEDSLRACEPMTEESTSQAAAAHTIVKIQVPLEMPRGAVYWLMCYNKDRKIQTMIDPRTPAGKKLRKIIEENGVPAPMSRKGCKGYFKAFINESDLTQLNIVEKIHKPQPW